MDSPLDIGHNLVVGGNTMTSTIRLEGFGVGGFDLSVVGEHDVLIPTVRLDG